MAAINQIALVGHCAADTHMLADWVNRMAKGVPVVSIGDTQALESCAQPETLVLINRVLDGLFETDGGIDLIRMLSQRKNAPLMMLISNYDDAQQAAVEAGAIRGFGKSSLQDSDTTTLLQRVLHDLDDGSS